MFHQVEGLAVDKDISMANLKWTLEEFVKAFLTLIMLNCVFVRRTFLSLSPRQRSTCVVLGKMGNCAWGRVTIGWKYLAAEWFIQKCWLLVV